MNEIKCEICKKNIEENDEIIIGSKDDYTTLPVDIKSSNVAFLHTDCLTQYLKKINEENKNE